MTKNELIPQSGIPIQMVLGIVGAVVGLLFGLRAAYVHFSPEREVRREITKQGYAERCIGGVAYIDNGKAITPKLMTNGLPASCRIE